MRSIIIPYVSRHCGLLNEISRVCGSFWYTPVTAVMSSTGPEIFIVAYFLPISPLLPLCSLTLRFPDTHHSVHQPLCPRLTSSVPSPVLSLPLPQKTPRYFQKKPHVPQVSSLLSLLLVSSVPFSYPFSPLLSIPLCGCPEPQLLHQNRKQDRKKWRNNVPSRSNAAGGFLHLQQHLPPTPSSRRTVSPCLPSVLLHPITNTAVNHLFLVLEALPTCDPPRWLQFFTLFLMAGCFPISLCNSKHTLSATSLLVFILCSVFWRCVHLLNSCLRRFWRWSVEKKLGLVYSRGVCSVRV